MRIVWGVVLVLLALPSFAECTKDTDCKGDRICTAGQCVDSDRPASQPTVSVVAQADRIARVAALKTEVTDLRAELEDATLPPPIMKMVGGTALGVLAVIGWTNWSNAVDCESRGFTSCGSPSTILPIVSVVTAGALALFIWGSVQLNLRVKAKRRIPGEIETREAQLRLLESE